ncbi:MAG: LysM peptidoglycan-binding domain-containing protein [Elusimicrobia bacterium]|nr:LysM peptidoglycan-binding domain-containing protein [Elusimicrobiota bacterium]
MRLILAAVLGVLSAPASGQGDAVEAGGRASPAPSRERSAAGDASQGFQSVAVKPGDTLRSIAQAFLKDPARWDEIARSNNLASQDPSAALPAMVLRLPSKFVRDEFQAARLVYRLSTSYFRRKDGTQWVLTADNMELFRNDAVKTMAGAKVVVKFADEELMQIDSDSMAIIMPLAKDYHVELKRGGVVSGNRKVMLGSAMVSPATADTVYTAALRSDKSTLVQVYRGEAAVKSAGRTVQVSAGKATEVKAGVAPSLPFDIPDLGGLKSWVAGFESQLAAFKLKLGKPGLPSKAAVKPLPASEVKEAADLAREAAAAGTINALMGYRIQCSREKDFKTIITDRFFELDNPVKPESFNLPFNQYWCRVAAVDLLGIQAPFRPAQAYYLGSSR